LCAFPCKRRDTKKIVRIPSEKSPKEGPCFLFFGTHAKRKEKENASVFLVFSCNKKNIQ